jgi:HAD superfamily hydrolase (TIGR01509 family)
MDENCMISRGLTKPKFQWLGRQFWNQTFKDDVEAEIDEFRQLLDMDEDCGEDRQRIIKPMIKAIIFDADGPLYFRKPDVIEAQLELLNKFGYPERLSHGHMAHLNKYGHLGSLNDFNAAYDKEKFKGYVREESVPVMTKHILHAVGLDLSGKKLQTFADELQRLHRRVSPAPGALEALRRVKRMGFETCVLTDSYYSSEEKWVWFRDIGLAKYLDDMVSSYDIRVLKDTPEAFWACLGALKVSAGEAVFVGHQPYEMAGAKAAGVKSVAVLPIAPDGIKADFSVSSLTELPGLLESLNKTKA